jgi:hypothetical protein
LDLFDYISENQSSSLSIKDKTYDKIISHLDEFIKSLPEKDKQILLQVISKSYLKYHDSITKGNGNTIFEINTGLLMSILIDQQIQIDKLTEKSKVG